MRRGWWAAVASLVVGVLIGAAAVCLLSARASRLYVQMVRFAFASEEERRLVAAWNRGDLESAARHAACGIEVEGETSSFDPSKSYWDLAFPATGLWVNERTRYPVSDRKNLLALAHARMGLVLERLGRTEQAASEYAEAGRLGESADVEKWRRAASTTLGGVSSGQPSK